MRQLLTDLHYTTSDVQTVRIYRDCKPALSLTINPEHHSRTKHIEVPWHFVREQVQLGKVILMYLPTTAMLADGFTKPLIGSNFDVFVRLLGLACAPTGNEFSSKKIARS